ncbi:MAG TPA: choice-of-anchor C family protein [Pirellulales bacterium]|jgi:choice-of-anchor C domain-containing protein|nr:choice-of-anchor C family protein [Pirellulales bacterium]
MRPKLRNTASQLAILIYAGVGLSFSTELRPAHGQQFAARPTQYLPAAVDLTKEQTPIFDQGGRWTCIFQPEVAALEAAYGRAGIHVRLSVEHLIWMSHSVELTENKIIDSDVNENGLADDGGGSMVARYRVLSKYGVSRAEDMAYRPDYEDPKAGYFRGFNVGNYRWQDPFPQIALNRYNLSPVQYPQAARQNARYGIKQFVVLSERDRRDPRKIEAILAAGHEVGVVIPIYFQKGTAEKGRGNIPPVVWYRAADAVPEGALHGLLIVGYDRPRQFFIVKNSWGPNNGGYDPAKLPDGWKDIAKYKGFTLIHYNYLNDCDQAAYITQVVDPKSNAFYRQPMIGLWNVEFHQKSTGRKITSAVLAWRRLPGTDPNIKNDRRIGDFYWHGRQYRVNAMLGAGNPIRATLFIDFDHPQTGYSETRGAQFHGVVSIHDDKPCAFESESIDNAGQGQKMFNVDVGDLACSAVEAIDENPLLKIPTPNLLVNGSFEDGPMAKDFVSLNPGATAIKGWTVTRGQIDYIHAHWKADDGERSLDLHGSPGYGGVAQTFKTLKGRRYRVTFSLAGTPGANPATKRVAVVAAGKQQAFEFDSTGKSLQAMGWSTKTWEFVAVADETTLEIYTLETTDPTRGPALDNVRVVRVIR